MGTIGFNTAEGPGRAGVSHEAGCPAGIWSEEVGCSVWLVVTMAEALLAARNRAKHSVG